LVENFTWQKIFIDDRNEERSFDSLAFTTLQVRRKSYCSESATGCT